MAKKKKFSTKRIAIFSIGMIIGLGLIVFDQFDTISGLTTGDLTGLTLIDVPIDPTTGQILGTVKFGAPIEVPFDRSGTVLSADGACQSLKDLNDRSKGSEIKFGRVGSGDRNAEVSFHNWNGINCSYGYAQWDLSKLPNDFIATGFTLQLNLKQIQSGQQRCGIGYVDDTIEEIGLTRLPNRSLWGNNEGSFGFPSGSTLLTSLVPDASPIFSSTKTDFLVVGHNVVNKPKLDNDWCESTGVKRWTFAQIEPTSFLRVGDPLEIREPLVASNTRINIQAGVDAFNAQLRKGTDKFTIVFYGGSFIGGSGANVIDHLWWEENGSLLVTGSSQPIKCNVGFEQIGFRCVAIVCPLGEIVDIFTNQCVPIQCPVGEFLQILDSTLIACPSVCIIDFPIDIALEEPLIRDPDDFVNGDVQPIIFPTCENTCNFQTSRAFCFPLPEDSDCAFDEALVDGVCQPVKIEFVCDVELFCNEGFLPNETGCQCELIECSLGQELVGGSCQSITCPLNTVLVGSDCMPRTCMFGQVSIDNVCQNVENLTDLDGTPIQIFIECASGFKQIGDNCVPIDLDCPDGTVPQENVCVKFLPSLTVTSAPELGTISIIGIVTFAGSLFGLVGSTRRT